MKLACFTIMFLLVAALVNATPMDVHEAASSSSADLMKGVRGFLAKARGVLASDKRDVVGSTEHQMQTTRLRVNSQAAMKEDMLGGKACISREHCKKKRVICSKKCGRSRGGIRKKHLPRCMVKCRKCIPTC